MHVIRAYSHILRRTGSGSPTADEVARELARAALGDARVRTQIRSL